MIRLLIWIWRYVIVGPKLLPTRRCVRRCADFPLWITPAASYCLNGLCVECCERRCKCLADKIAETKKALAA